IRALRRRDTSRWKSGVEESCGAVRASGDRAVSLFAGWRVSRGFVRWGEPDDVANMEGAVKMERREVLGVITVAAGSVLLPESLSAAAGQAPAANNLPTERVTGIGGVFFRARDPKALAQWYQDHLGVTGQVWTQEAGPTALTPFPEKTNYFGDSTKQWMINFRVNDLDKM